MLLQLRGARALSDFRLAKLLPQLQRVQPAVRAIQAEYRHFIELEAALSPSEQSVLEQLLRYGDAPAASGSDDAQYLVVPRIGTLSPWASKATDIAHNCGLGKVRPRAGSATRPGAWHGRHGSRSRAARRGIT